MPISAVLLVRLPSLPDWGEPNRWRRDILTAFNTDSFRYDGPMKIIEPADRWGPMLGDSGVWFDVGICEPYYGQGYERGDLKLIIRVAEWLETRITDAEVWYGHDASDAFERFGLTERAALMDYFNQFGCEPYEARSRKARDHQS